MDVSDDYPEVPDTFEEDQPPADALNHFAETRVPFSREDLKNAESLRTSDYKPIALDIINNSPFSMEYKQELAKWAHRSFTTDRLLSDTSPRKSGMFIRYDPYETEILTAKLDLVKRRLSRSKSDTMEPASHNIEDDLMSVFLCLLSRTYGVKRERLINSVLKTENESISRTGTLEQPQDVKPKKKGWFGAGK